MSHTTSQGLAEVNGTRLYYELAGTGAAVVLLHGFTLDTSMWDDQFQHLAGEFQVLRYDLRGFGRSAVPAGEEYSHVEDLKALLDLLKLEHVRLVGLSKGGAVALDFTLTYPETVQALVLLDAVLPGFEWSAAGTARDRQVWEAADQGGIPAAKRSWLAHPLFAPAHRQPAVSARLTRIIENYSGWHFVNRNHEQNLLPPAAERLGEISIPTLAIVGEYDLPDFLTITNRIGQELPHAQKLVIPQVGHMSNMEAPHAVNQAISEFLKGL